MIWTDRSGRESGKGDDPYDAGVAAWLEGAPHSANPYAANSQESEDWTCGFDDASCDQDDEPSEESVPLEPIAANRR